MIISVTDVSAQLNGLIADLTSRAITVWPDIEMPAAWNADQLARSLLGRGKLHLSPGNAAHIVTRGLLGWSNRGTVGTVDAPFWSSPTGRAMVFMNVAGPSDTLSLTETAAVLSVSRQRVTQLCAEEKLSLIPGGGVSVASISKRMRDMFEVVD